jgi:hypothetical protein
MAGDSRLPNLPRDAAVTGRERLVGRTQNIAPASLPRGARIESEAARGPSVDTTLSAPRGDASDVASCLATEGQVQMPGWLNSQVGRDIHHGYC